MSATDVIVPLAKMVAWGIAYFAIPALLIYGLVRLEQLIKRLRRRPAEPDTADNDIALWTQELTDYHNAQHKGKNR